MKTTVEMRDSLLLRTKFKALHEGKKFKGIMVELLERGLTEVPTRPKKLPPPHKLRRGFIPTAENIEVAIAEGRD